MLREHHGDLLVLAGAGAAGHDAVAEGRVPHPVAGTERALLLRPRLLHQPLDVRTLGHGHWVLGVGCWAFGGRRSGCSSLPASPPALIPGPWPLPPGPCPPTPAGKIRL